MSKEGVKDLLEAIEPDYQSARIREQKQSTIASSLPTDTEKRESAFKQGYNTMKKGLYKDYNNVKKGFKQGYNTMKKGFKQSYNTMKKGVYKDYNNVKKGFKKGVQQFSNFRDRRKQMSEEEKAEKTRIFNENRQTLLNEFSRIQELSNGSNTVDSFRENINEILNYTDKLIAFKNKKRRRLQNDSEFSNLVSNIGIILVKLKRFSETSIGSSATATNSLNYKRIEKLISELNIDLPDESDSDDEVEEEMPEPTPEPTPEPPPEATPEPPPEPTPEPTPEPPPEQTTEETVCQEKLSFFNIKDRTSFLQFTRIYHPDKGFDGKESEINRYLERYPPTTSIDSMEEKQNYLFQEVNNCADVLKIKDIRGGSRRTVKKKKKNIRRTR